MPPTRRCIHRSPRMGIFQDSVLKRDRLIKLGRTGRLFSLGVFLALLCWCEMALICDDSSAPEESIINRININ